jgi:hypothetical protein
MHREVRLYQVMLHYVARHLVELDHVPWMSVYQDASCGVCTSVTAYKPFQAEMYSFSLFVHPKLLQYNAA